MRNSISLSGLLHNSAKVFGKTQKISSVVLFNNRKTIVRRGFSHLRNAAVALSAVTMLIAGGSDHAAAQTAQPPFACTSTMYLAQNAPTGLFSFDTSRNPITVKPVGKASAYTYNAVAYNPQDNFLYGFSNTGDLLRIGSDGSVVNLGKVPNLNLPAETFNSGEISPDGIFYVRQQGGNQLYRINLSTKAVSVLTLSQSLSIADLAWHNGLLYTVDNATATLYTINPSGGQVTRVGPTGASGAVFGALFGASNGLYGGNNKGGFYQFDLTTGAATLISNLPGSTNNDGAKCAVTPMEFPVDLAITKDNGRDVVVRGKTTYTIAVSNAGPFGVQNVLVNDALPAGITEAQWTCSAPVKGGVCGVASGTGGMDNVPVNLPAGASVTFEMTMTVPASFTDNLVNTATVTSPEGSPDINSDNNTATDIDTHQLDFGVCDATMYLAQYNNTQLFQFDARSNPFIVNAVGSASGKMYNAIGFNPVDKYIYGVQGSNPPNLVRIGQDGSLVNLGPVDGFTGGSVAAEIGPDGTFYALQAGRITKINIPSMTATSVPLSMGVSAHDLAWHNGMLYAAAAKLRTH
ncbi:DUF6923 family protein [Pseudochrobactrum sp. HB0163]|uniref:DUF11 domain-containing protein n=1 Tax=Pseudochrobactrum sp. HB0163 TaxID=3450708 RepID=UPI003F6DC12B